jgi:hypothetical protein
VHLALAFPFGAMDRQAPQQEGDDVFVCVVMYRERESIVPSFLPPSAPRISVDQRIWIPADHRILSGAAE